MSTRILCIAVMSNFVVLADAAKIKRPNLDQMLDKVIAKLENIESKHTEEVEKLDKKLNAVESKLDNSVEKVIKPLESKVDSLAQGVLTVDEHLFEHINNTKDWEVNKIIYKGWRGSGRTSLSNTMECGKNQAMLRCQSSSKCDVVTYDSDNKTCSYYSWKDVLVKNASDTSEIMLRRKIPVLIFRDKVRYQFTFEQAKVVCASVGGRLIAESEMQHAYKLGYEMCSCGWWQDRQIGYVMQKGIRGCGGDYPGIRKCTWISKADAYCTFQ